MLLFAYRENRRRINQIGIRMTLNDRLRILRGDVSYKEFARRVAWPLNTVRRYELGLTRVPADYVQAVCCEFRVTSDWLLFGVEASTDDVIRSGRIPAVQATSKRYVMVDGEKVHLVCVPVLNKVPAGPITEMADDTPVGYGQFGGILIPDLGDENAFGLKAWGDSMAPIIKDGDVFVVSPRRRFDFTRGLAVVRILEVEASPGGDYAQREICVKYVRRRAGRVSIISVNPNYPTRTFKPEQLDILGQVYALWDMSTPDSSCDGLFTWQPDPSCEHVTFTQQNVGVVERV